MNHKEFVESEKQGRLLVGIDRTMARKFYVNVPVRQIENETGERLYAEKTVVILALFAGPVSLLASIVIGFWFFGWWGIISLVICPILYFSFSASSIRGDAKITWVSLLLVISASIYFFDLFDIKNIAGFSTTFIFSLWSIRFLYYSSTLFLRSFIVRNEKAYQYFLPHLVLRPVE